MTLESETAYYLLGLAAMTLKRVPRNAPVDDPDSHHDLPAAVASLRKDGKDIPFFFLAPLEVGKPARFLLRLRADGVETSRTTTDVLAIITELFPRVGGGPTGNHINVGSLQGGHLLDK